MVETFSPDKVAVRTLSDINDGARSSPLLKRLTASAKNLHHTFDPISNTDSTGGAVNVGCRWTACAWNSSSQTGLQGSG